MLLSIIAKYSAVVHIPYSFAYLISVCNRWELNVLERHQTTFRSTNLAIAASLYPTDASSSALCCPSVGAWPNLGL